MSKDLVYRLLSQYPGQFVSGEEISRQAEISRAAVWKAVDGLRKAGYTIEARSGLGYALMGSPDALSQREIHSQLLRLDVAPARLDCLEEVDSTNSYLKRIALEGAPHGTVAVANYQTGGRGRISRTFLSPKDKGVYLSILLRPKLTPEQLLPVTALTAVAVCDAIENTCGLRPQIKWTNDLLLGGKKLVGILTEVALEGETGAVESLVIGAGVNVHHTDADFTPEVAKMATALSAQAGYPVSRPQLAAEMIAALLCLSEDLSGDLSRYRTAYRQDCLTLGREVQLLWSDSQETVFAEDIDDQFGLIVRRGDGSRTTIRSGEVSVRGLYGYAN